MSFLYRVTSADAKMQETMYPIEAADMMYAAVVGILMMSVQNAYTKILQDDVAKFTEDEAKYGSDSEKLSAHLQADQVLYQTDSSKMQAATNENRGLFDAEKQQVTTDTGNEKSFTQVINFVTSIMSTETNLVQKGASYGKQT